jgi:predicted RNase H-like nuclease
MKYIGIDGCKAGWFLVGMDRQGKAMFALLHAIDALSAYLADAESILLDIPIGLKTTDPHERTCDKLARKLLSPYRHASVFPAPSRCALACDDYPQALASNRECTGRGLTKQTFNIMPKIREVDEYLQRPGERQIIREMHPEVCFWALNDQQAMRNKKRTQQGFEERLAVLNHYFPDVGQFIDQAMQQTLRKQVARDDMVDAIVGAVTASQVKALQSLPQAPETDDEGLPMEIVFAIP